MKNDFSYMKTIFFQAQYSNFATNTLEMRQFWSFTFSANHHFMVQIVCIFYVKLLSIKKLQYMQALMTHAVVSNSVLLAKFLTQVQSALDTYKLSKPKLKINYQTLPRRCAVLKFTYFFSFAIKIILQEQYQLTYLLFFNLIFT